MRVAKAMYPIPISGLAAVSAEALLRLELLLGERVVSLSAVSDIVTQDGGLKTHVLQLAHDSAYPEESDSHRARMHRGNRHRAAARVTQANPLSPESQLRSRKIVSRLEAIVSGKSLFRNTRSGYSSSSHLPRSSQPFFNELPAQLLRHPMAVAVLHRYREPPMDSGFYAACAALMARSQALDLVANNLANTSTPGYRGQHNIFRSFLATASGHHGSGLNQAVNDFGISGGSQMDLTQGNLEHTGNDLDFASSRTRILSKWRPPTARSTRATEIFKCRPRDS